MKKLVKLMALALAFTSLVACTSSKKEEPAVENKEATATPTAETTEKASDDKKEDAKMETADGGMYKDGEYVASAKGNNGDVEVSVKIVSGKIDTVTVTKHEETEGISDPAIEKVPAEIVEKQSVEVDSVSGATVTSEAIKQAVATALEEASK